MYILDINMKSKEKQLKKTIWVYLILSASAVAFDRIYDIFGHGVDSAAMTWMFLYPLIGGALYYFIISRASPHITKFTGYRVFFNIHNSGIAALTLASLLNGIFEIAGTDSPYLVYYYITGGVFVVVGLIIMLIMAINRNRVC